MPKFVNKPYRCSKCLQPMHMKRTVQFKVQFKSQGNRSSIQQAISKKPELCLVCYEEFIKMIQETIHGFYGRKKMEQWHVICPGCDKPVEVDMDKMEAKCEDCNTTAHMKWTWKKPNGDDIEENE